MRTITVALFAFTIFSSCRAAGDPGAGPEASSPLLARIDGEPVSTAAYRAWLADVYGGQGRDEYFGLLLLEREARRLGITVSTEEIDAARESLWANWIRENLKGDASKLDEYLAQQGHDRESYRRWYHWQKRRELLAAKIIHHDRKIDEAALGQRFEKEYGPGGVRTQVRLLILTRAHLLKELALKPHARTLTAAEADELLMQKAEALRAQVLAGTAKFEDVVRAESADLAVRKDGGLCSDEQWRLRGQAFVRAVEAAPPHVVQPPVVNSSGIDLFEVVSSVKTRLEDVRAKLTEQMLAEAPTLDEVMALDHRLRAASRIERL